MAERPLDLAQVYAREYGVANGDATGPAEARHDEEVRVDRLHVVREEMKREIARTIVGHDEAIDLLLLAAIAGGHVLMEGPPGVAKTLLSSAVARALGVRFTRVQFTPDTRPLDITGEVVRRAGERVLEEGPVFTNVLLADEINRTPPRTQAALLEAMQEGHVTIDGRARWLPRPFCVVATQNPYEHEGIFPLPESQLDRFLFKAILRYGDEAQELEMLRLPHRGLTPDTLEDVRPMLDAPRLQHVQLQVDRVEVPAAVGRYVVALVRATRTVPGVILGGSPRAAIHLVTAAKANARVEERTSASVDDVRRMADAVLRHRLLTDGRDPREVVREAIAAADAA